MHPYLQALLVFLFYLIPSLLFSNSFNQKQLENLTLDEKIGQLFVIPIRQNLSMQLLEHAKKTLDTYYIGSVLLKQSDPLLQIQLVNALQQERPIPLFTLQDSEWGLSMQLEPALRFPKNMTLAAIQDEELLYSFASEVAKELKLVGVHIALMPVMDINTNPLNPIIGERSFGDDPQSVTRKALLVMHGLQDHGIIACAKHFPGHGDTSQDSHHTLPKILSDKEELFQRELIPFKKAIQEGIMAIMPAHLNIPSLQTNSNLPSSLSPEVVTDLLQNELEFQGLIITDALNMKGANQTLNPGKIALEAFLAGNDLLLYGSHLYEDLQDIYDVFLPQAFQAIKNACLSGQISKELLDSRVLKILNAKAACGLFSHESLDETISYTTLFSKEAKNLKKTLFEKALTLVDDHGTFEKRGSNFSWVEFGNTQKPLSPHCLQFDKNTSLETMQNKIAAIDAHTTLVIALFGANRFKASSYGLSTEILECLHKLDRPAILVLFGSPYALFAMPSLPTLVAYEDDPCTQKAVLDALEGKLIPEGKLPIYLNKSLGEVDKNSSKEIP